MDEIIPVVDTPLVTGQPAPTAPTDEALGEEAFLRLLTEQLQNQDPLDPMKNEEFVAQLAQFSSLEQLFGLQATMEAVYLGIASMNNASMATLLGTDVVALGDTVHLDESGSESLHFEAASSFSQATITLTDESGRVVQTLEIGGRDAGAFEVEWDGTDLDGQRLEEGDYTFSIEATDADGQPVAVDTLITGIVDEMDYSTGTPQPSIQGVSVPLEDIRRLTDGTPGAQP
ncbi:MAG TPA: flagellar hook assembly protein FlgD [Deltaproteobacteria bacterium]|nr:flagellar hook assembly protein FlgD [Deltaproteobacteria bacterium]